MGTFQNVPKFLKKNLSERNRTCSVRTLKKCSVRTERSLVPWNGAYVHINHTPKIYDAEQQSYILCMHISATLCTIGVILRYF